MLANINNISDGAGAYFLISKKEVSILIFSSTNYVLKNFPEAAALYKRNMVIYSTIRTAMSANSDKILVAPVEDFKHRLQMMLLTSATVVVPYNTPVNRITEACTFVKCSYSADWFKKEAAFIHKKLMEFMTSNDPFQLKKAIANIQRSMK
jgi:hypothetical protein